MDYKADSKNNSQEQKDRRSSKFNISERSDRNEAVIGPALPPHLQKINHYEKDSVGPQFPQDLPNEQTNKEQSYIGPALPPHLLYKGSEENETDLKESGKIIVGPALPPHLQRSTQPSETHTEDVDEDDDSCGSLENDRRENNSLGPRLPPHLLKKQTTNEQSYIGPALPPHLLNKGAEKDETDLKESEKIIVGPAMPPHLQRSAQQFETHTEDTDENDTCGSLDNDQVKNDSVGPQLPPHLLNKQASSEQRYMGPALPPHLLKRGSSQNEDDLKGNGKGTVGPALPPHLQRSAQPPEARIEDSDEDDDTYGPLPAGHLNKAQVALEERALQLKMDRLGPAQDEAPSREEWMIELPQVKALSVLGLGNRQFRSKPGPDLSDRSCWTDTPSGSGKRKADKSDHLDLKKEAEKAKTRRRDEEQEEMLKKHKKKGKESLLEMHQKKQKKDKKGSGESNERRPFSRDIDLQVNRFDEAQKKAILKKAQLLDDRFSKGQSKFL